MHHPWRPGGHVQGWLPRLWRVSSSDLITSPQLSENHSANVKRILDTISKVPQDLDTLSEKIGLYSEDTELLNRANDFICTLEDTILAFTNLLLQHGFSQYPGTTNL